MKCLLDTHFLIWTVLGVARLDEFPWLEEYGPWGVSPISLVELQFLAEVGKLELSAAEFLDALLRDGRFVVDEVPLLSIVRHALPLHWTRDPFDRLLVAHARLRGWRLATGDAVLLDHLDERLRLEI